jgi:hypothetical protein
MSSPGSAVTVELPARLLADRLSVALAVACAVAIESTLARHPGMPWGVGLVAGGLLLAWQWRRVQRRPGRIAIGPGGVAVQLAGRGVPVPATGPRARVLGRSVVLHWRDAGASGTAWLTPADLPSAVLRAIRVRVQARGAAAR